MDYSTQMSDVTTLSDQQEAAMYNILSSLLTDLDTVMGPVSTVANNYPTSFTGNVEITNFVRSFDLFKRRVGNFIDQYEAANPPAE